MSDVKGIYVGGTPINFKDETSRNLISDVYDTTKQYEIGDYCINNNKLYIATIRPAVGGFDGSCWKETTMSAEVSKQNKNIVHTDITLHKYDTHTLNECYAQKNINHVTVSINASINLGLDASDTWYALSKIYDETAIPQKTFYFPVVHNYSNITIGRITPSGDIEFVTKSSVYTANTPIICNFSYFV